MADSDDDDVEVGLENDFEALVSVSSLSSHRNWCVRLHTSLKSSVIQLRFLLSIIMNVCIVSMVPPPANDGSLVLSSRESTSLYLFLLVCLLSISDVGGKFVILHSEALQMSLRLSSNRTRAQDFKNEIKSKREQTITLTSKSNGKGQGTTGSKQPARESCV